MFQKLDFTLLSYPLSYECAGIQILNDSKVRQGDLVIVQKAEILQDRWGFVLGYPGLEDTIRGWDPEVSRKDLPETEGRQSFSQIGQRRPRLEVTI